MTDLTIAGETFNVLIEGDETNPVLVLAHPLGSTLKIWDAQIPALVKHFRVVRYDSRGHGGSIASEGPYSIAQLGRDALAILDALGIEKAHWLGISKGGVIGQWLLINAPERIERAVLANTAAQFGAPEDWNNRILSVKNEGVEATADWLLQRWFSDDFLETQEALVEPVRQDLLATSPEAYAATCAALRDLDLREGLRQIAHPVLIIAGADDPVAARPQTDLLVEAIANAKLVTLNTRHISNVEDPAGFTKAAVDFLTAKIPTRRDAIRPTVSPLPVARRPAGRRLAGRGTASEPLARRTATKTNPAREAAVTPAKSAAKPETTKTEKKSAAKPATRKTVAPKATAPKAQISKSQAAKTEPAKTKPAKPPVAKAPAAKAKAAAPKTTAKKAPASKVQAPVSKAKAPASKTAAKAKTTRVVAKPGKKVAAKPAVAVKPAKKAAAKIAPVKAKATNSVTKPVAAKKQAKPAAKPMAVKTTRKPAAEVKAPAPKAKASKTAKAPARRTGRRK
ncbi:MAG: 3-oxoadipate enol-lactonase [Beijerinckiaceae bacterium]|nr:3-oxoadipate enol-lactonase [Beijerinckiaceae bacterium]